MANTLRKIYAGVPGTSSATLYTTPASTHTLIKSIVLCNTSASAATVTLTFAGQTLVSAYSVASKDTVTIDLNLVLEDADLIAGLQGTASAISVYISGVENA